MWDEYWIYIVGRAMYSCFHLCYTHMMNEVQSRDIVRGSEGEIIVDLLDGLLVAAPSMFSRVNVRCKSKTDNTHPCFFTVPVSLEEIQALVPVIVMPVQTIHGCLRGILTGAGRTSNAQPRSLGRRAQKMKDILCKLRRYGTFLHANLK